MFITTIFIYISYLYDKLSFPNKLENGSYSVLEYRLPKNVSDELVENFMLDSNKNYCFSFSSFLLFNKNTHGKAISFAFNKIPNNITRIVLDEDDKDYKVTYILQKDIGNQLNKNGLIFIAKIFHQLDLKKYLTPVCSILIHKYKIKYGLLKDLIKDDTFKCDLYEI